MTSLQMVLQEYSQDRASMGEADLEKKLTVFSQDFRFGYYFQLAIVAIIFVLTVVAVSWIWQDSAAIAVASWRSGLRRRRLVFA